MHIPLDRQSDIPLYQQIEDYLRWNILSGSLEPDTRLPATRQLAQDLGVSRITVKNAYASLESAGLIGSRPGSGTYVLPPGPVPAHLKPDSDVDWPLWQQNALLSDAPLCEMDPDRILQQHPEPIAFTGVGDPRQFPVDDFYKAMRTVMRRDGIAALEYGDFDGGYFPLRETVTHILVNQGIQVRPNNVLITSGSQQALALVCQLLLNPGDIVLAEKPTYDFALDLFRALNLKIKGIPLDAQGMQVKLLEAILQKYHPKLIYTIPNFQNPTGVCLSGARRRQLIALADCYNIPILEDDFAGDLRYEGYIQPAIKALDPGGRVIYVGTFSKMLMPGLRVGFLAADGPVFKSLLNFKCINDLTTSTFTQRTLNEYVTVGRYQAHLRRSCRVYHERRDAMLSAIKRHLPAGVHVDPPQGGLFIWLRLPGNLSSHDLLPLAAEEGVGFAPGGRFFPDPSEGYSYLRLNFATQTPEDIERGIRRLQVALERLAASTR